jgi:hypothetical protein
MKIGPKADTLFSKFWAEAEPHVVGNPNQTPYNLMRWAFREGFAMRGERDRRARSLNETGVDGG